MSTLDYKNNQLTNKEYDLESERNDLSLLPSVYTSVNQSNSNDRSYKSIQNSSLYVGLSQQLYAGGIYAKTKKRIEIDKQYNAALLKETKNQLLIELFSDTIEYKYILDQMAVYQNQLSRQLNEIRRMEVGLASGDIARIDVDIAKLRVGNINNIINSLRENKENLASQIYIKYGLPQNDIKKIDYDIITSCKSGSYNNNLLQSYHLQLKQAMNNKDIRDASSLPSVNFSVSLSPPDSGLLNDISTRKVDFITSINVSIPFSQLFLKNNSLKNFAIERERLKLTYDNKVQENIREKKSTIENINLLTKSIRHTKESLDLEKYKLSYIQSRIKEGRDSIITYYQQVDTYENLEITLKKEERELEFKKAYLHFLD
ncbi:TPA: TolC family protein [Escherichia coli]|nr:TolC family protein [Escherichia coli]HCB2839933.1 TolC family protein [Escherichia coli]